MVFKRVTEPLPWIPTYRDHTEQSRPGRVWRRCTDANGFREERRGTDGSMMVVMGCEGGFKRLLLQLLKGDTIEATGQCRRSKTGDGDDAVVVVMR